MAVDATSTRLIKKLKKPRHFRLPFPFPVPRIDRQILQAEIEKILPNEIEQQQPKRNHWRGPGKLDLAFEKKKKPKMEANDRGGMC